MLLLFSACRDENRGVFYNNVRIRTIKRINNETDRRDAGATGAPLGVALLQALREMPMSRLIW